MSDDLDTFERLVKAALLRRQTKQNDLAARIAAVLRDKNKAVPTKNRLYKGIQAALKDKSKAAPVGNRIYDRIQEKLRADT